MEKIVDQAALEKSMTLQKGYIDKGDQANATRIQQLESTTEQQGNDIESLKKVTGDLLGTYTEDKNVIVDTQKTTLAHTTEYIVGYDDSSSYTNYRKLVKAVVSTHQDVNTTCYIHVGFVDQRGWWIESSKHSAEVSAGNNKYEKTITPQDECVIPKGEFVLFEFTTDMWYFGNGGTFWKNLPNLYCVSSSDNLYNQSIISKRVDSVYLRKVEMYYTYYSDQKVALKDEMTSLQTNIDTLETALDASKIYTDKSTNKKYSIVVRDGKLQLVSESITKVYYAGNSFTHHGTNDYWWGYGRGMAASSFSTQYVELTSKLLNATYDKNTYASSIEVHLNNSSYDASTDIPSLPDSGYDLVVIQLGENASVTNSTNYKTNCGKVIDRFRSLCPGAKIMWLMGWYNATKATLIKDACEAHDAYFLDVSNETKRGAFRRGDYVLGASEDMKDNTEEHEVPSNIITHPSDIGMAAISDAIVSKLGYPERCQLYDIVVNTSGFGNLSIPYSQWIAGGLVSCKLVINNSSYTLSSITVTNDNTGDDISTTKHLNSSNDTVYTFIMPASSVTITLEWAYKN